MTKNMRSARQNPEVMTDYLLTECTAGRVIGPFGWHMFPPGSVQTNQFRVIPKETTGKWCLIVNLSSPEGLSMNDRVNTELCSGENGGCCTGSGKTLVKHLDG